MKGITRQGSYRAREVNSCNDSTTNVTNKKTLLLPVADRCVKQYKLKNCYCILILNLQKSITIFTLWYDAQAVNIYNLYIDSPEPVIPARSVQLQQQKAGYRVCNRI